MESLKEDTEQEIFENNDFLTYYLGFEKLQDNFLENYDV